MLQGTEPEDRITQDFLRPKLRSGLLSIPLTSTGQSKSQGQSRVKSEGNRHHFLKAGAAVSSPRVQI